MGGSSKIWALSWYHHHHHHQSLNREGHWGTTDDFATSFLHFSLFSTALWDLPNSRPVHSLMLSSHIFLCLPCLLPPFTVPCKMVLARPDERETWPYHCSLRLFTIIRSSCALVFAQALIIFATPPSVLVSNQQCVWGVFVLISIHWRGIRTICVPCNSICMGVWCLKRSTKLQLIRKLYPLNLGAKGRWNGLYAEKLAVCLSFVCEPPPLLCLSEGSVVLFIFCKCIVSLEFLLLEIQVAFPGKSQPRQLCYPTYSASSVF